MVPSRPELIRIERTDVQELNSFHGQVDADKNGQWFGNNGKVYYRDMDDKYLSNVMHFVQRNNRHAHAEGELIYYFPNLYAEALYRITNNISVPAGTRVRG